MYEDTEQMSDGHRRSLSLPSHLGRQSSGQKRRDGPSIWDLQEALRREGHLDAESECTSEPGSEPSSAASTPHGSLGASSGAAFAEQFEQAYGGGSWPRVRKQRTSERSASAMSLWEVSEALGGGASAAGGGSASMDAVLAGRPSAAEPPRVSQREESTGLGDGLAHLNLQGSLGDGTEAPPEGGISRRSSSGAIDGPPLLEEEEQSSEEAEAQAEEEALALLQALVDEEEMPNAARSSPAFAALAAPAAAIDVDELGLGMDPEELLRMLAPGAADPAMGYLGEGYPGAGLSLGVEPSYDDWRPPPACAVGALPTGAELIPMTSSPSFNPAGPALGANGLPAPALAMSDVDPLGGAGGAAFGAFNEQPSRKGKGAASTLTPAVVAGVSQGMATGMASGRNGSERKEWSAAEDDTIRNGVALHGCKWRKIAAMLPGRSDDAVRNRWNRLKNEDAAAAAAEGGEVSAPPPPKPAAPRKPKAEKEEGGGAKPERVSWSRAEDATIVHSVAELGHKWYLIAQRLPGRTDHAIRNRYHRLQAMSEDQQILRGQYAAQQGLHFDGAPPAPPVGDPNLSAVLGPVPEILA